MIIRFIKIKQHILRSTSRG